MINTLLLAHGHSQQVTGADGGAPAYPQPVGSLRDFVDPDCGICAGRGYIYQGGAWYQTTCECCHQGNRAYWAHQQRLNEQAARERAYWQWYGEQVRRARSEYLAGRNPGYMTPVNPWPDGYQTSYFSAEEKALDEEMKAAEANGTYNYDYFTRRIEDLKRRGLMRS